MKTWKKVCVALGICLLVVGGALTAAGWAMGGERELIIHGWGDTPTAVFTMLGGTADRQRVDEAVEPFQNLTVAVQEGNIRVEKGAAYKVELEWNGLRSSLAYEIADNTLYITGTYKQPFFNINFTWFSKHKTTIIVTIPEGATLNRLDVDVSMGNVIMKNVTAAQGNISADLGNVEAQNLTSDNVTVTASMGNVIMKNVTAAQGNISADLGDVEAQNLTSDNVTVTASMGNVILEGDLGSATIDCDMGNVEYKTSRDEALFGYYLVTDLGRVEVDGRKMNNTATNEVENARYQLAITNSAGNVEVFFH